MKPTSANGFNNAISFLLVANKNQFFFIEFMKGRVLSGRRLNVIGVVDINLSFKSAISMHR